MNWKKRVYCDSEEIRRVNEEVMLMGWVDALRDHGNLLFIHLRDITGLVQVVFNPTLNPSAYNKALSLKVEYVVKIKGRVSMRDEATRNPNLSTGDVEIIAEQMEILSEASALPFQISEKAIELGEQIESSPEKVDEELRLRYRYLDLRRPSVQELFKKRYEIIRCIRNYFHERGFMELETPFLTKSTPEGARDYLVPSRLHKDKFYALPQSPQLFKQLFMIGGMERYFQIVRCFRDEDLRPNRQPEFTQMDLEASFVDEEFIYELLEELTCRIFAIGGIDLQRPFPRMPYQDAIERYGSDRPDLRFDMSFVDVSDCFHDTSYGIFRRILAAGGVVKGFCVKGKAAQMSKNLLQNEYALKIVPALGAKGMTWMKVSEKGLESNIVQFFSSSEQERILERFAAQEGDVIMMIADSSRELVNRVLCDLRLNVGNRMGLISSDSFMPLWVTEFPLFELKEERISSQHHPFTMPDRTEFDPSDRGALMNLKSRAYDLVMNGEELGGGSIRIHRMDIQRKIFKALGLSQKEIEAKFGFFLRALEFGTPPHAGLALGIDRVVAMILKTNSIREVITFPKNRRAVCPMTQAPSGVGLSQLKELGLGSAKSAAPVIKKSKMPIERSGAEIEEPDSEKISLSEVAHVARLARLRLTTDEETAFQREINEILDHFKTLSELETDKIKPMSNVTRARNVWRDDKPGTKESCADSILSNAPSREGESFKVPRILEG